MKTAIAFVVGIGFAAGLLACLVPLDKPYLVASSDVIVMDGERRLAILPAGAEIAIEECRDVDKMVEAVVRIGDRKGAVKGADFHVRWERRPLMQGGKLSCQRW